ncbi:MAG: rod shape-determining protein MreC [Terriglobales bacterium]
MENFFTRYRNVTVLLVLLMAQVILLATQVRRPGNATGESMSLVRFWVVEVFVPAEKGINALGDGVASLWRNYIDLRGVRAQNEALQSQLDRLRLDQVGLAEDAGQARRLQALLSFKEKFVSETVAAQVIGTSGSEQSHLLYIDKGSGDGIKADMAVITPRGIVGKVNRVFPGTSQILEINDATAGAGVMLERSRLRGVLRGTASGIPEILHVMADEHIEVGEPVVSSGGDQIYPRGLPIGTVSSVSPDPDGGPFMLVRVKPSADLERVDEVLVITKTVDKGPALQDAGKSLRAADILAQRLPTVAPKPPERTGAEPPSTAVLFAKKPASAAPGTATDVPKAPVLKTGISRLKPESPSISSGTSSSVLKNSGTAAPGGSEPTATVPFGALETATSTVKTPGNDTENPQPRATVPQEKPKPVAPAAVPLQDNQQSQETPR